MIKVALARNDDGALRAWDWQRGGSRMDLSILCKLTARHRELRRTPNGGQPGSAQPRAT